MKYIVKTFLIGTIIGLASTANAACFAEYKAKRDNPLRLHYGIAQISSGGCPAAATAQSQLQSRLANGGWVLLQLQSLSTATPTAQMKGDAGEFYLRY